MHDDELTPDERDAFDALPRERRPSDLLEERTVRALRARGLLGRGARVRPFFSPAWATAAAAAAVAVFVSGFAVGQYLESRNTQQVMLTMHKQDAEQAAAMVQRAGSAYVAALSALADQADTTRTLGGGGGARAQEVAEGREVAVNILHAAANQLVRIAPEEPLTAKILQGLDRAAGKDTTAGAQVVWF